MYMVYFVIGYLVSIPKPTCSSSYFLTVERKDQKTLEKLRAERKAKIDELKERTNYYLTQQLIQVSRQVDFLSFFRKQRRAALHK
jgi:hypothetical protein